MRVYQDIGIIQFKLSNTTQHKKIISTARDFINHRTSNQIVLFNSYNEITDNQKVPILHLSQSKFFYGNIVVFDIDSLDFACHCVNRSSIIYYATSLPWEQSIQKFYGWKQLFDTSDLKIVAANTIINDLFSIGMREPVCVAPEFSYETFKNII